MHLEQAITQTGLAQVAKPIDDMMNFHFKGAPKKLQTFTHNRKRTNGQTAEPSQTTGEVLTMANERQAYALADRGTTIAYSAKTDLIVLQEGAPQLFNPYGVIIVNPGRHPHIAYRLAMEFVEYLTSSKARQVINGYRLYGQQLFFAGSNL